MRGHEFGSIGDLLKDRNGYKRTPQQYHQYLLQCAKDWDAGVCCRRPQHEQASKVRKMAAKFADRHHLKETV